MKLSRGFTLIELLITISIIAVLSVIGMTVYTGVQSRARDAQRLDDARKIITVLEQYKSGAGKYPGIGTCTNVWCVSSPYNVAWIPDIDRTNFIKGEIPKDPINVPVDAADTIPDAAYYYSVNAAGDYYCLEIPQENNAKGHPNINISTANPDGYVHHIWKLRFGPTGPSGGGGVC